MATLRKRGEKWHVQVRRKGSAPQTRSFMHKADAQKWARQMEAEADRRGLPADPKELKSLTVGELITRYRDTVVPKKRGCEIETIIINAFLRDPLAKVALANATPRDFGAYRDKRLAKVKPATINRELGILQHAYDVARREWAIGLDENPVAAIRKPKLGHPRDRRLQPGEWETLVEAMGRCRNGLVAPIVWLALETGMRRSEILKAKWADVDLEGHTLKLEQTKNGHPRTVPLSTRSVEIIRALPSHGGDRLFPMSINAFKLAWKRIQGRANVPNLHFHDLRHEAVSRFFERGLSVPEVALISGHRDPRMLFRYTHLRAEDVAAKLG